MDKNAKFIIGDIALAFGAIIWVLAINWTTNKLLEKSFFIWYIEHGFEIGFIQTFLAIIWRDINKREDLISIYPSICMAEYCAFAYAFFSSMGSIRSAEKKSIAYSLPYADFFYSISDIIGLLILIILDILVLAWFVFIVPLQYFIFLFTGSVGRLFLNVNIKAVGIKKLGSIGDFGAFDIIWVPVEKQIEENNFEFTFHDKAITLTFAITGLSFTIIDAII